MSYLIDTHWIISYLNGRPDALALIRRLLGQRVAISTVTYGETYEGLLGSPAAAVLIAVFDGFVQTLEVIAPDIDVAREYARVRADLRARGQLIGDNDLWIAATALAHDLTLVSRDQHFQRITDLKLL